MLHIKRKLLISIYGHSRERIAVMDIASDIGGKWVDEKREEFCSSCAESRIDVFAERYPVSAFRTNLVGTFNVLEAVRLFGVGMVIFASSIATFGEGVSDPVSNEATQKPMTMYGVTKVASERLGEYYCGRFGVNFRALRLPSIVGVGRGPGGASAYSTLMIEKPARGESSLESIPIRKVRDIGNVCQ